MRVPEPDHQPCAKAPLTSNGRGTGERRPRLEKESLQRLDSVLRFASCRVEDELRDGFLQLAIICPLQPALARPWPLPLRLSSEAGLAAYFRVQVLACGSKR
jgi:hypothetical protein